MSHDSFFKTKPVVEDYKPVTILVFKNGDEYDPGTKVTVTRNRFPHWLHLLDYLTTKLQMTEGPVHHLYDLYKNEQLHFKELENDGVYVAANKKFKQVRYNSKRHFGIGKSKKQFDTTSGSPLSTDPKSLHSKESYEIYLKNRNFQPSTLRDMWNDNPGKRTKFVSTGTESLQGKENRTNVNQTNNRKFPYHLYDSTKQHNVQHDSKNHLSSHGMQNRTQSEPRLKVAQAGTVPKLQGTFTYSSQPKYVHSRLSKVAHAHTEATNHIHQNGHRIGENSSSLHGAQTRHTKSASVGRTHGSLQNNTIRSSLSDSHIKMHEQDMHIEQPKPYLEVYKYYDKGTYVEQSTSAEWDSETEPEKEVSTQTTSWHERATNTTASYLKQKQDHRLPVLKNRGRNDQGNATADVTVPSWAKQLQSAVNELSEKVEHLNV